MRTEYNAMYAFLRRYCKDIEILLEPQIHMSIAAQCAIDSYNHRQDEFSGWLNFTNDFLFRIGNKVSGITDGKL